jgi:hypothetical protein
MGERMSRYPTEAELERVRFWSVTEALGWVDYVSGLWEYGEPYCRRTQRRWYLSTGGWSGNESVIEAMHDSILWGFAFLAHRRGGHYVLDLTALRKVDASGVSG